MQMTLKSQLLIICFCYLTYLPLYMSKEEQTLKQRMKQQDTRNNTSNITTCEEFLRNTTLDVMKVIDVDWKIFYFWNHDKDNSYNIRFSLASSMLVKRYRVELEDEISNVNWTSAELFMETAVDISGLFLKTNTSGLYLLIPSIAFQAEKMKYLLFGLKYVEPGYLAIMNCKYQLCYGLAPVDQMPRPDELEAAAAKIGFRSEMRRSYLVSQRAPPSMAEQPVLEDDVDDDIQTEIDARMTNYLF